MKNPDEDIARKLAETIAEAIAGDAQVDWSDLDLDPSALAGRLENLRRLSRVANSFDRHLRGEPHPVVPGTVGPPRRRSHAGAEHWGSLEILGSLGEGAFGSVHLAFDPMLEREVALKLWKHDADASASPLERERQVRRFLEEARRMARIRHPHVVVVYGAGVHDGRVGIWSERLSGETLAGRLAREGPFRLVDVARLGAQVAEALAAVHAGGLVHGDVKESNVALEESGRAVLFDFGSSRNLGEATSIEPPASTPFYLPAEVLLDGGELSPSSDIYALGVLLHRLRTGHYPVEADSLEILLERHRNRRSGVSEASVETAVSAGPAESSESAESAERHPETGTRPPPPSNQVEDDLRGLIERAIAPHPADRPASARELARALRYIEERAVERDTPVSLWEPTTRLFGREAEIARVQDRLRSVRLLTLTGIGGAGKSRLAIASVRRMIGEFPDGVFWVPLATLRSEADIVSAMLASIGMTDRIGGEVRDLVLRLAGRRLLLVLDNAEHLVDSLRGLAEEILVHAGSVHLLVTSRRALGGPSEELFRVAPLPVPPAPDEASREELEPVGAVSNPCVDLFADRARRRDPDFDLTRSRRAVEFICRRLEGIPLAIEIAAARAATFSPEDIADRLGQRIEVGIDEGAPARQRSLRTSMVWSHDLLPRETRVAFRRLAAFADGWRTDAVIDVGALSEFVARESLATLYEHSLVERRRDTEGGLRFSMLETVREFAEERLDAAGEIEETSLRHHAHYRARVRVDGASLSTHDYPAALGRLEAENANLERAIAWGLRRAQADPGTAEEHSGFVLDAIGFWHLSGRDSVAVRHLSDAIASCGAPSAAVALGRLYLARGRFFYLRGFSAAEDDLRHARELLEHSDRAAWARAEAALGATATAQLRFAEADMRITAALREFEGLDDPGARCLGLRYLADLRYKEGRMDDAGAVAEQAETMARELGDPVALAMILLVRASVTWARGDLAASIAIHEECLDVTAGAPLLPARSICHANLGTVHWSLGESDVALRHWKLAERLARRWGEDLRRATHLINLAGYFPLPDRSQILVEALDIFLRFNHLRNVVLALSELGAHALDLGHSDLGVSLLALSETSRADGNITFPPPIAAGLLTPVARARAALPAEAFEEHWARGREMSVQTARAIVQSTLLQPSLGATRPRGTLEAP